MPDAREDAARRMHEAAAAWSDALDAGQREKATFSFGDEAERTSWAYFPRNHAGLPLHEMDIRQQKLAHVLISSALSLHAYAKVCAVMALESVLNLLEGRERDGARDPGRYFLSLFGAPGAPRWGWRLEGHHVCLNCTFVDGLLVSPTPLFLGANPAAVERHGHAALRPCAAEEDAVRELLASLDADRRREAVICDTAPPDFVLANAALVPETAGAAELVPPFTRRVREINEAWEALPAAAARALRFDRAAPRGLPAARMDAAQRALFDELVDVYISRLPDGLAALERERIGTDDACFAWAGSDRPGEGHYYRLQSATFLVEYDNTQDGANHVHAVWRNPRNDFGIDPLRGHAAAVH
jgi:hypothetical protein